MQELYHYNIEDFYRFTLSESELILERRPARGEEKTATERIPLEDVTACAHTELHLNRDGTPYPLIALTIRSAGFFDQEEGEQQIYPATPELVRDLDAHHVPIIDQEKLQRAAPDLKSPKQVFSRTDGAGEYILILSLLLAGTGALTGLLWALAGPAAGVAALVCGIAATLFYALKKAPLRRCSRFYDGFFTLEERGPLYRDYIILYDEDVLNFTLINENILLETELQYVALPGDAPLLKALSERLSAVYNENGKTLDEIRGIF